MSAMDSPELSTTIRTSRRSSAMLTTFRATCPPLRDREEIVWPHSGGVTHVSEHVTHLSGTPCHRCPRSGQRSLAPKDERTLTPVSSPLQVRIRCSPQRTEDLGGGDVTLLRASLEATLTNRPF